MLAVSAGYFVRLVDVDNGAMLHQVGRHRSHVRDLSFRPDGRIWLLRATMSPSSYGIPKPVISSRRSRDTRGISTALHGVLMVESWPLRVPIKAFGFGMENADFAGIPLNGPSLSVNGVSFHPDGGLLAAAQDNGYVEIWDVRTSTHLRRLLSGGNNRYQAVWNPDGARMILRNTDAISYKATYRSGTHRPLAGLQRDPVDVALNPDGTLLATGSSMEIKLWQTPRRTASRWAT